MQLINPNRCASVSVQLQFSRLFDVFSNDLCRDLIAAYDEDSAAFYQFIKRFEGGFECWGSYSLYDGDPLRDSVLRRLTPVINGVPGEVRVHRWMAEDFCRLHQDDAFKTSSVVIIRLDEHSDEERFYAAGMPLPELTGCGYVLPPMMPHEVKRGKTERYTLVAWFDLAGLSIC